jgi:hypothetical protein
VLTSLARANGLLVVPEQVDVAECGMRLPVLMFDWDLGDDVSLAGLAPV